jgi:hypothetical protein
MLSNGTCENIPLEEEEEEEEEEEGSIMIWINRLSECP